MREIEMLFTILPLAALATALSYPNASQSTSLLWDKAPATVWNQSYIIGSGWLGASTTGSPAAEVLAMNHESFWSGGPLNRTNPDALRYMNGLQSEVVNGMTPEAETLASYSYVAQPVSTRHYEPLSQIEFNMEHSTNYTDYQRYLDLSDATAGVVYTNNGTQYKREYFASNPANLIVIHITSSTPHGLNFHVHQRRQLAASSLNRWEDYSHAYYNNTLLMTGVSASRDGIEYATGIKGVSSTGKVFTIGDTLLVRNATQATLYFTATTSFRQADPEAWVLSHLSGLNQSYSQIRNAAVKDYQSLHQRVDLNLGTSSPAQRAMTTAERVTAYVGNSTFDPELISLYFQFGRYLLIGSSRVGGLPANLQGIWNNNYDPFWGSKYTTNINLQMNYWSSFVTNLQEVTQPLYDLIGTIEKNGAQVARQMYNCSGWVSHHNTDLYGDSAPQDNYASSTWWPMAGPWLTLHLMEHYRFTLDTSFLHTWYPTLRSSAVFMSQFMTSYGPYRVTNPSMSPENRYYVNGTNGSTAAITMGPAMDTEMLWELFNELKEINALLKLGDDAFVEEMQALKDLLPPLKVNYFGGLQEWIEDFEESMPGIDHLSPIWAAYPGSQLTSALHPALYAAAHETLLHRLAAGSASGGWSSAWCTNLAARFFDESSLQHCVYRLMVNAIPASLMNSGLPADWQIDGNLGAPAGLAEMLVQSHEMVVVSNNGSGLVAVETGTVGGYQTLIRLLPTLPRAWVEVGGAGFVKGLRARGGFTVDVAWDAQGVLTSATVGSEVGGTVFVTLGRSVVGAADGVKLKSQGCVSDGFLKLETVKGGKYVVKLA